MKFLAQSNEQEVNLRLQFEAKLNGLHSIQRDLESRYDRAKEEIYELEVTKKNNKVEIETQKNELVVLRALRIEHETKIAYLTDKLNIAN